MLAAGYARAAAAACADNTQAGALTISVPKLPTSGTYNIWTRLQVPDDTHNRYRLEVNEQTCYLVGGSSITPGAWTWVSFQDGNLSSKVTYNFTKISGNSLKLTAADTGVRVDRVLLVKNDCVPVDMGTNCQSEQASSSSLDTAGATVLPPPSNGPVSGVVIPSPTITHNPALIARVVYFADGNPMPTTKTNGLDTTLLSNGTHQISMQITKTDASVVNEATTLTVTNPQTIFSPVRRWIRLNQATTVYLSAGVGIMLLVLAAYLIFKHIRLQKRLLTFHGF